MTKPTLALVALALLTSIPARGQAANDAGAITARGLTMRTLDRNEPRVVDGVLRDGRENSDNPTRNNIVVIPAVNTGHYTGISCSAAAIGGEEEVHNTCCTCGESEREGERARQAQEWDWPVGRGGLLEGKRASESCPSIASRREPEEAVDSSSP